MQVKFIGGCIDGYAFELESLWADHIPFTFVFKNPDITVGNFYGYAHDESDDDIIYYIEHGYKNWMATKR